MADIINAALVHRTFRARFLDFLDMLAYRPEGAPSEASELYKRLHTHFQANPDGLPIQERKNFWIDVASTFGASSKADLATKLAQKRVDYGAGGITAFGEQGIIIRTVDKLFRVANLSARGGNSAVGESIQDAFDDIVGYAAVAYLYVDNQWEDSTIQESGPPEVPHAMVFTSPSGAAPPGVGNISATGVKLRKRRAG